MPLKAADPEFRIQAAFVTMVSLAYPELLFTIAPSGFIMSVGMAMKMMRMGYRKGTPDLLFFEPRGPFHGLLIEFKAPRGTISDAQREFARLADERGYKTAFCFSTAEGITTLDKYLRLPIPPRSLQ
jgi:hypothetical protein